MLADAKQRVDRKPSFMIESILRLIDNDPVSGSGTSMTVPKAEPAPSPRSADSDRKYENRKHRRSEDIATASSEPVAFDVRQDSGFAPLRRNVSLRSTDTSTRSRTPCDDSSSDFTPMLEARRESTPSDSTPNLNFFRRSTPYNDSLSQRYWVSTPDRFSSSGEIFDHAVPPSLMTVAAADALYFLAGRQRPNEVDEDPFRRRRPDQAAIKHSSDGERRCDNEHHHNVMLHQQAMSQSGYNAGEFIY